MVINKSEFMLRIYAFDPNKSLGSSINFNLNSFIFRIQDSDGGFFERFGSLLHARGENNEDHIIDNASLVHPDLPRTRDAMPAGSDVTFEARSSVEDDSGNESIEYSEPEEKREEDIKKLVGMNVSRLELYGRLEIITFLNYG
jgi:hypothetical protein